MLEKILSLTWAQLALPELRHRASYYRLPIQFVDRNMLAVRKGTHRVQHVDDDFSACGDAIDFEMEGGTVSPKPYPPRSDERNADVSKMQKVVRTDIAFLQAKRLGLIPNRLQMFRDGNPVAARRNP